MLSLSGGEYRLSGRAVPACTSARSAIWGNPLRSIGARIDYVGKEGYPPLAIHAGNIRIEGHLKVRGNVSSQYLSSLLIALPLAGGGTIEVEGELISKPYVTITLNMMHKFGADVRVSAWKTFEVPGHSYIAPKEIHVKATHPPPLLPRRRAISGGPCRDRRRQGHTRRRALHRGAGKNARASNSRRLDRGLFRSRLQPIDLDLNHIRCGNDRRHRALFADGPSTIRNIAAHKETDRITAMATELRKLGATVVEGPIS